jgi:hypothetical protein
MVVFPLAHVTPPRPRPLCLKSPDKVLELVERGGGFKDVAERQAFDHGIAVGRGGVYLSLTGEQYAALKRRNSGPTTGRQDTTRL